MKKVVITGVSSGIGYSSAKILCNSGYFVYGSVRKNDDADRLRSELGSNFQPLIFDVVESKCAKGILMDAWRINKLNFYAWGSGVDADPSSNYDHMCVYFIIWVR